MATKTVLITSGTTWTVPSDYSAGTNATVVSIGGGGGGGRGKKATNAGLGGGGGALSRGILLNLVASATVYVNIGAAGTGATADDSSGTTGGDTWLNWDTGTQTSSNTAPTSNSTGVLAKGGIGGTRGLSTAGGAGGACGGDERAGHTRAVAVQAQAHIARSTRADRDGQGGHAAGDLLPVGNQIQGVGGHGQAAALLRPHVEGRGVVPAGNVGHAGDHLQRGAGGCGGGVVKHGGGKGADVRNDLVELLHCVQNVAAGGGRAVCAGVGVGGGNGNGGPGHG